MQLNHLHLSVTDAAAAFFVKHFNFTLLETRGTNGMAILNGQHGVVLVLMRLGSGIDPEKAVEVGHEPVAAGLSTNLQ